MSYYTNGSSYSYDPSTPYAASAAYGTRYAAPPAQPQAGSGGHSAVTIILIILGTIFAIMILICVIWCICECVKNNKKKELERKRRGSKTIQFEFGEDKGSGENGFEQLIENGRKSLQTAFDNTSKWFKDTFDNKQKEKSFSESAEAPLTQINSKKSVKFSDNYADTTANNTAENKQQQHPQHPQQQDHAFGDAGSELAVMSPGTYMNRASNCDPDWAADNSSYANNLNVNHLMPASWRNEKPCTALNDTDTTEWAAYAPSKQAFDSYITTAGSARLSVNTRSAISRQTGMPNPLLDLRGGGGPPVPIGSNAMTFNDSDARQSIMYDATGIYPELNWC